MKLITFSELQAAVERDIERQEALRSLETVNTQQSETRAVVLPVEQPVVLPPFSANLKVPLTC